MRLPTQPFKLTLVAAAALALAGCAGDMAGGFGEAPARPKTIVVTDFLISSEVTVIDRGFTARLERKVGAYPTHERKPRTVARVNDEIVASIIASLREAGLDAQPGSEDALSLNDRALVVKGRLRPLNPVSEAKSKQIGFGTGRGGVVAEMTLSSFSGGGRRQLLTFIADAKDAGKPPAGKQAAARNAAIGAALTEEKAAAEKLSPDVEAQTRRLGRAVGEKIVAFAREKGWLEKPESGEAAPAAQGEEKPEAKSEPKSEAKPVPKPAPKQAAARKPAAKPAAPKSAAQKPSSKRVDAPENEEPPDTEVPDEKK
jgi:hypothetical protein